MPISNSRSAYEDCIALFDRALTAPAGIRTRVSDPGQANLLRQRLNRARINLRAESRQVYTETPTHPEYDRSPYDHLVVRILCHGEEWYVYIEPRGEYKVEELGAAE